MIMRMEYMNHSISKPTNTIKNMNCVIYINWSYTLKRNQARGEKCSSFKVKAYSNIQRRGCLCQPVKHVQFANKTESSLPGGTIKATKK